jgi:serine/threonine protein kinase
LHIRLGRIHADLKPENVLVSRQERRFRLIDYGSTVPRSQASVYETAEAGFELVSWMYRAPELLIGLTGGVTAAIDIWSLGCLAFEALAGRPLCQSTDRIQVLTALSEMLGPLPDAFKSGQYYSTALNFCLSSAYENGSDRSYWRRWRAANLRSVLNVKDTSFLDLLSRLLDPDPTCRISVDEIIRHPFIASMTPFISTPMHELSIDHAPLEFCSPAKAKENERPANKPAKKALVIRKKKPEETMPSPVVSEQAPKVLTEKQLPAPKKSSVAKAVKEAPPVGKTLIAASRNPDLPISSAKQASPFEIEFTQLPPTDAVPKDPVLKTMTRRVPQVTGKRRARV